MTGYFLFSLDTELAWGHFDCFQPAMFSADGSRERNAVRRILAMCDEYGIVGTWALVGQLFGGRTPEEDTYPAAWRGKYPVFERLYREGHPLLHGQDFAQLVLDRADRHEIAFHGFTHSPFDERQMSAQAADDEIHHWFRFSEGRCAPPTTVIFPRNKVGHLNIFSARGFNCYRGVELESRPHRAPLLGKAFRRFEELSSLLIPQVYDIPPPDANGMVNLPASRWLLGFNRRADHLLNGAGLGNLRVRPIIEGVHRAAQQGKVMHLWAHPYEFQTEADFEKLRRIFTAVARGIQQNTLQSVSMSALARIAIQRAREADSYNNPTALNTSSSAVS